MNLMKMRRAVIMTITVAFFLLMPLGSFASGYSSATPSLSGITSGAVMDAGNQLYIQQGGKLIGGSVMGHVLDPSQTSMQYTLVSKVSGQKVSGIYILSLRGSSLDGTAIHLESFEIIGDAIPAVQLPVGCSPANCQSEIPAMFSGMSSTTVTIGSHTQIISTPIGVESAYLNPWGAPLVTASSDGEINLVGTYSVGKIFWSNVQLAGTVQGTSGSIPVSGNFAMSVSSYEDLVAGTEVDHGTIAFSGMSLHTLNMEGHFHGSSTIPSAGSSDCSAQLGWPQGTCSTTGLVSSGILNFGHNMKGSYATTWSVPAIGFESQVSIS